MHHYIFKTRLNGFVRVSIIERRDVLRTSGHTPLGGFLRPHKLPRYAPLFLNVQDKDTDLLGLAVLSPALSQPAFLWGQSRILASCRAYTNSNFFYLAL